MNTLRIHRRKLPTVQMQRERREEAYSTASPREKKKTGTGQEQGGQERAGQELGEGHDTPMGRLGVRKDIYVGPFIYYVIQVVGRTSRGLGVRHIMTMTGGRGV